MKSVVATFSFFGLLGSAAAASVEPLRFDIAEADLSSLQKRSDVDVSESLVVSPHVLELRKVDGVAPRETWLRAISKGPDEHGLYETGHINNITYLNYAYISSIDFGDESLQVVVDTGSSDTWVVHKGFQCLDPYGLAYPDPSPCNFGPTYNGSFEGRPIPGVHLNISYQDGESATGPMGPLTITLAGLEVPHQQIALVNSSTWQGDGVISGVLGLGFDSGTSQFSEATREFVPYRAITTTIFKDGVVKPELFSMAMDAKSGTGQLALGGLPPVETTGEFISTPLRKLTTLVDKPLSKTEFSLFAILPDGYFVNNSTLAPTSDEKIASSKWNKALSKPADFSQNTTPLIVDSGSVVTHVPSDIADAWASLIPGAFWDIFSGLYFAPCNSTLPKFGVVINGHTFYANQEDLMRTSQPIDNEDGTFVCLLGIVDAFGGPYILGDTMLNSLVTVFDVGAGMMRFAHRK